MFTGIIETIGTIEAVSEEGTNVNFTISSDVSQDLKIDQSIAHDGVCLTVVDLGKDRHSVTAIAETLEKTALSSWEIGRQVNLERCMPMTGRFDGHVVQGHVDTVGTVTKIVDEDGSWRFYISHPVGEDFLTVAKGSITINGVSLTVVDSNSDSFSVAIIPYTYEHTGFKNLKEGDKVNIEFDIIGKYVKKLMKRSGLPT